MARAFPVDKVSKEATFAALSTKLGLDDKVKDLFSNGHIRNLEDFRHYFTDEMEIDTFVAIPGWSSPDLKRQASIVKQAWTAIRQIDLLKRDLSTASPATGIDLGLEVILKMASMRFWKRYKLHYTVEVFPSDSLLSRCYAEMEMRLLTVYNVWDVKASPHQISTNKESEDFITDFSTQGSEADTWPENQGVEDYLSALYTYLLALGVVGSTEMQDAPTEESFGTDPTKFVEVPLDILQTYYFRASRSAMRVPEASRLAWLTERDTAERTIWASRLRKGGRSLGHVIQSVMDESGNNWHTKIRRDVAQPAPDPSPKPPAQPLGTIWRHEAMRQGWLARQAASIRADAHIEAIETTPSTTASAFQDGWTLCPDIDKKMKRKRGGQKRREWMAKRKHLRWQREWMAKRKAAADAPTQTTTMDMAPSTALQALQEELQACPDLIKEASDILHRMSLRDATYQERTSRKGQWAQRNAVAKAQKKRPIIEATATDDDLVWQDKDTRHNPTVDCSPTQSWGAHAAAGHEGRVADKKAHQPTPRSIGKIASPVASSSHHEMALFPGLDGGISIDENTVRVPLESPSTHMRRMNSYTGDGNAGVTPGAPVSSPFAANEDKQGAYVKQALHRQQQGEDLGIREAYANTSTTLQQSTTTELTPSHSAFCPSAPYVPPGFYEDVGWD